MASSSSVTFDLDFDLGLSPILEPVPSLDDSFSDADLIAAAEQFETEETNRKSLNNPSPTPVADLADGSSAEPDEPVIKKTRFADLNDDDLDTLMKSATSQGTEKMTKWGVNVFIQWLQERGEDVDFHEVSSETLNTLLRRFYGEVRNKEGNHYSKSTFVGIRASINRFLRAPPYNRNICLMKDEFFGANQMFNSVLRKMKKDGLDKTAHHDPISEADLSKLRESDVLSRKSPKSLQRKVWFDITISFARRGCENMRELTQDAFVFRTDDSGCDYVEQAHKEATKNHPGDDLKDHDFEQKPRMYATGKPDCPVETLLFYLSKRNQTSKHFFQQPRNNPKPGEEWYTSRAIGKNPLFGMMKEISKEAGLSKIYTNHCIRATTITLLSHAGVESREIMRISGHKNEQSLKSYNTDSSAKQKRQYSAIIQGDKSESHSVGSNPGTSGNISAVVPYSQSNQTSTPISVSNTAAVPYKISCKSHSLGHLVCQTGNLKYIIQQSMFTTIFPSDIAYRTENIHSLRN